MLGGRERGETLEQKYLSLILGRNQGSPLSLAESFRVFLCHKELAQASKYQTSLFACSSLFLYGVRIVDFHARNGSISWHKEPVMSKAELILYGRRLLTTPSNSPRHRVENTDPGAQARNASV